MIHHPHTIQSMLWKSIIMAEPATTVPAASPMHMIHGYVLANKKSIWPMQKWQISHGFVTYPISSSSILPTWQDHVLARMVVHDEQAMTVIIACSKQWCIQAHTSDKLASRQGVLVSNSIRSALAMPFILLFWLVLLSCCYCIAGLAIVPPSTPPGGKMLNLLTIMLVILLEHWLLFAYFDSSILLVWHGNKS